MFRSFRARIFWAILLVATASAGLSLWLARQWMEDRQLDEARAVLLRAVPADVDGADAAAALEEIAGKLISEQGADPAAARDSLLATLACKAAIKGGWKSDERELRALVDKVQSGEIEYCPHGRPVKVKLTQREIEKMFKRIV